MRHLGILLTLLIVLVGCGSQTEPVAVQPQPQQPVHQADVQAQPVTDPSPTGAPEPTALPEPTLMPTIDPANVINAGTGDAVFGIAAIYFIDSEFLPSPLVQYSGASTFGAIANRTEFATEGSKLRKGEVGISDWSQLDGKPGELIAVWTCRNLQSSPERFVGFYVAEGTNPDDGTELRWNSTFTVHSQSWAGGGFELGEHLRRRGEAHNWISGTRDAAGYMVIVLTSGTEFHYKLVAGVGTTLPQDPDPAVEAGLEGELQDKLFVQFRDGSWREWFKSN